MKANSEIIEMNDEMKKARAKYMREYMKEWRKKNPKKDKEIRLRYWQKKATEMYAGE